MRILAQFVGILLLVGFVGAYFWPIVAVLAISAAAWGLWRVWPRWCAQMDARDVERVAAAEARAARRSAIARRADQQHAWAMAGDERGVYGAYPPATL
jgi:hypothetical protein